MNEPPEYIKEIILDFFVEHSVPRIIEQERKEATQNDHTRTASR